MRTGRPTGPAEFFIAGAEYALMQTLLYTRDYWKELRIRADTGGIPCSSRMILEVRVIQLRCGRHSGFAYPTEGISPVSPPSGDLPSKGGQSAPSALGRGSPGLGPVASRHGYMGSSRQIGAGIEPLHVTRILTSGVIFRGQSARLHPDE